MLKMGNLFSGSGAWELASEICGIKPLWEAEIEPFPVKLEAKRFPDCIQLGDVSKIDGSKIPKVDIFTNSSPCQDLSVAGNRKGLDGERSGLFMDAVRIAKEMRNSGTGTDDDIRYPRFWLWENVPGALSSNNGEDFRVCLEEVAKIKDESAHIPKPDCKWHNAGVVTGTDWEIAWGILDAQYMGRGTAQRRRRLYLIADLDGHSAGKILSQSEGLSWDFAEIRKAWQRTSVSLEDRIDEASRIVERQFRG